ncbi:MAG: alkaline phosphatase family protein [Chloroflexi bacterium]|nr:alkaline phosphatase family protein [Chloroflexota bacterium]
MSLADTILAQIQAERQARFLLLDLPPEWIAPNYTGRSILNVAANTLQLLGAPHLHPPLDAAILDGLATDVERIVLVVVDALGYRKLTDALDANPENGFHALMRQGGRILPLTSVFPSTTTAALTSLWSGYTPAEHGLLGFELFLRDFGIRANMIYFSPVAQSKLGTDQLIAAGLNPETFVPVPSLPQTLAQAGVPTFQLIPLPFVKSGLTRVQIRGARELRGFVASSDMWVVLRTLLAQHAERALFVAYWSAVDGIAHMYGPSSETLTAEINNLAYSFEREFLRSLPRAARRRTLFLLTADHGQIDTPPEHTIYLRDHPDLQSHLIMDATGDARAAYLYCRQGHAAAVRDYFAAHFPEQFVLLDSQAALDQGLFGSGTLAPEARDRVGDLLALARGDYLLDASREGPKLLGRHGSLTPEEMLVPLLAARLD